jgi:hypothetical protein
MIVATPAIYPRYSERAGALPLGLGILGSRGAFL